MARRGEGNLRGLREGGDVLLVLHQVPQQPDPHGGSEEREELGRPLEVDRSDVVAVRQGGAPGIHVERLTFQ